MRLNYRARALGLAWLIVLAGACGGGDSPSSDAGVDAGRTGGVSGGGRGGGSGATGGTATGGAATGGALGGGGRGGSTVTGGQPGGSGGNGLGGSTGGAAGSVAGSGGNSAGLGGGGRAGSSGGTGGTAQGGGGAAGGSSVAGSAQGGSAGALGGSIAGAGGQAQGGARGGAGGAASCTTGAACSTSSVTSGLCAGGVCAACVDGTGDAACATAYGAGSICAGGKCVTGDCHTNSDCAGGGICGAGGTANTCGSCGTSDAACTTAYGNGHICYLGACVAGNCHGTSAECAGKLCLNNVCTSCTADNQCANDPTYKSGQTVCDTSNGDTKLGQCVAPTCSTERTTCAQNTGDFCCSSSCVSGNCCDNTDCLNALGAGWSCQAHVCSKCDAVSGKTYYVDPVGGSDATATGSGKSGGNASAACAFKTVRRVLQVLGAGAGTGTQIVVLGTSGSTTALADSFATPLVIPANVVLTTQGGAVVANLAANQTGFTLGGNGSGLAGGASAPFTIDGKGVSASAINTSLTTGQTASLAALTVQNTGPVADAVVVSGGSVLFLPGVTVTNAGTSSTQRSGLRINGGTVTLQAGANEAPIRFKNNTQHGIFLTGTGMLNVSGVASASGNGTGSVMVSDNGVAGLWFAQTPQAVATTSTIVGLAASGAGTSNNGNTVSGAANGIRILGGSNVSLRSSVSVGNSGNGIMVSAYTATTAGTDLTKIDLGSSSSPGHNVFQQKLSLPNNAGVGICLSGIATGTLSARGNVFGGTDTSQGPLDCSVATPVTTLVKNKTCGNHADVGVTGNATVDTLNCP